MGGRLSDDNAPLSGADDVPMRKFVRVTGARLGRYVEFEFIINDEALTVELILPFEAFEEFCRLQQAETLPPSAEAADKLQQLAWRAKQPGLLRRVMGDSDAPQD